MRLRMGQAQRQTDGEGEELLLAFMTGGRQQAAGSTDDDAAEAAAMWQRTLAPRRPSKEGNSFGSRLPSERFEGKAAKRRELRTAN